jgi:DNA-binding transcriptional ArsR family regulator
MATYLCGLFHGLADPTRRAVLERLAQGPASVSELARPFAMARQSFMRHLAVLEEAGLVMSEKTGRVRVFRLRMNPVKSCEKWLAARREIWEAGVTVRPVA